MHTQYLVSAVPRRRKARSESPASSSQAGERRMLTAVAGMPYGLGHRLGYATDWRMPPAVPRIQSKRVWPTIVRMARTPRPGSPISHATVLANSSSAEALDLLPSLSFRHWIKNVFLLASGSTLGTRKQPSPASSCANTRNASDIGAEQNHLWPVRRK